ncbi:MAG: GNAT family N-acetyltransferase [Hyphomicrobiaceae bacterium]
MTGMERAPLQDGYTDIPAGKIAAIATSLAMRAAPVGLQMPSAPSGVALRRVPCPGNGWYRDLFRKVGAPWLWHSRLRSSDAALGAILADDEVEVSVLVDSAGPSDVEIGILELDFRVPGTCEIAFFGVVPEAIGRGLGRYLMTHALATAWARPIESVWLHTCTLDHPGALAFYLRSGFRTERQQLELADDPRLTGHLPMSAAPHIPIYPRPGA